MSNRPNSTRTATFGKRTRMSLAVGENWSKWQRGELEDFQRILTNRHDLVLEIRERPHYL